MLRRRTVLELCDPDPFTVATWILMSLTTRCCSCCPEASCSDTSVVAIPILPLWIRANLESLGVRVEMKWNPSLYGRSSSWFRCQGYCLNSYAVELAEQYAICPPADERENVFGSLLEFGVGGWLKINRPER